MSDESVAPRDPICEPIQPETTTPEERAARIDALMAQPIKERAQITIFGDDDVVGINPAPAKRGA